MHCSFTIEFEVVVLLFNKSLYVTLLHKFIRLEIYLVNLEAFYDAFKILEKYGIYVIIKKSVREILDFEKIKD